MAIRCFFEYNGTVVQLPVNPESLEVVSKGNNRSVEVINLGEVMLLKTKKLLSIKLNSFLPSTADGPYVLTKGKFEPPNTYIELFEKIIADKRPCKFIVTDADINMDVSIEDFKHGYTGGDSDVYYDLELKEYKQITLREVVIKETETAVVAEEVVTARAPVGYAIGDAVTVNGNYYASSYGDEPHGLFNGFAGKISHIVVDKTRPYRYHITTPTGGYRGWVKESQMIHR